ncbi:glycosyltransferase [Allokutzneria albata]|uniref:UDP:flavonoid glycosyltransferase YjiC, YdhE family n=1 Tax=Allokutzneria albata TaxID=211114 RepID=A0A1G9SSX9_ALLAB|nr:glycosyltransferase [Allokutzneria albata]SDM38447.1 UDP:flavonoid glycosyltransferase YjiC, YdhE family [Allokutzneria albata]
MRVLLSTFGSRGDVQPMAALAVRLRELGAEPVVCAPPDEEFEALLARNGVPMVPAAWSVREMVTGKKRPEELDFNQVATNLINAQYDAVSAAAREGCDVLVATGLFPAAAAVRAVADELGAGYVLVGFFPSLFPSPHHRPHEYPGQPLPTDITDNRVLWELDAERMNKTFGAVVNTHRESIGLAPVDNVRDHVFTHSPWVAADPFLAPWKEPADLDVVQTGAWILPDSRPLPADLTEFLDAGEPPVYVGFGSMPMRAATDAAEVAIEAVRAQGRRVLIGRGWAALGLTDGQDDCFAVGEVNQQALFPRVAAVVHHGGAGTTTTAALAGAPQVIVPQLVDQPLWAARVAELGIGAAHDGPVPTLDSLTAAVREALMPEVRVRAAEVASKVRTDGAATAAKLLIEKFA